MVSVPLLLFLLAEPQPAATVPAGTRLEAKLQSSIKTGSSEVGDDVVAVVTTPLRTANQVVVPRGSRLNGRIETIRAATRTDEGRVRLVFRQIELPDGRRVSTWITNSFEASTPHRGLRYVLFMSTGAAAGGLIGGKIETGRSGGGQKSTARVAGILGGLLAGFVVAGTRDDSTLPNLTLRHGKTIRLELGEDLTIN